MSIPPSQPSARAHCRCRAAAGLGRCGPILLLVLTAAVAACAGRNAEKISADVVRRDRAAREALEVAIAEDHAALADLIASDRFAELEAVYADPELRAIALRLVEHTQALRRLDDTNVLAPVVP